jgi:hypothetical protein
MRFNKKGQAAMEFLMTYGWAILIAIIAIAALIAFGGGTGKGTANTCGSRNALMTGLACKELKGIGGATPTLQIILVNSIGNRLNITGESFTACTGAIDIGVLEDGEESSTLTFTGCTCSSGRIKGTFTFTYQVGDETLTYTVSAPINARCE